MLNSLREFVVAVIDASSRFKVKSASYMSDIMTRDISNTINYNRRNAAASGGTPLRAASFA